MPPCNARPASCVMQALLLRAAKSLSRRQAQSSLHGLRKDGMYCVLRHEQPWGCDIGACAASVVVRA